MSKPVGKKNKYKSEAALTPDSIAVDETPAQEPVPVAARVSKYCAIAFSAGVALLVASTIAVVILTYTPLPKWDHWAEVLWLRNYYAGQWHLSDLLLQHNEHRILFPRLFLLVDWFLFRGENVFLLCSMLLLQAAHAWIFIREVRSWKQLSAAVRLTVVAIIVALFFSGANLDNFTWPFQISFILAFYAGTVSLYALIRFAEVGRRRRARMAAAGWLAASVVSGIVATHSLANGILIWPVLLLTGAALKLHRRVLLAIGIVSGLVAWQFFTGYHLIAGHGNAIDALRQPFSVLAFVGAYLALPLTKIEHALGAAVGLALLIAFGWIAFRLLRRRQALPRLVILSLAVMLYIVAGAFVTALGRLAVAPPEAALRYVTPVCIFWACALLLALAEAETLPQPNSAVPAILATAITALVATILPMHVERSVASLDFAKTVRETEVALRSAVDAKTQIALIYPDPQLAFSLIEVLRAHHRSVFAGNPIIAEEPLPPEFQLVSRNRCRGTWEFTLSLNGPGQPGASASGWAWDNAANRPPDQIVFLDASRLIRGFATFTRDREDVATAFRSSRMASSGWFGFIQGVPGYPPYQAYALLNDGRSLCPINNSADVPGALYTVFRQGQWTVNSNKTGIWQPGDRTFQFGIPGDIPVSGDWDGSGVTRAGVFRNGQWLIDWNNNGRWDDTDHQITFGLPGDLPVVGDWNHNGVSKVGVFRGGTWFLDWNGDQRFGPGTRQFVFGLPGDIPVAGDWDGSGLTRIGVFRRGIWYLDNGDFKLDFHDKVAVFGLPDDHPVTGDWTGLGVTKIGVFRNGQWVLDSAGKFNWDPHDGSASFGLPGDVPVPWKK